MESYGMKVPSTSPSMTKISQAKKVNADVIVTIGGGSLTDGAKVVRIALETGTTHGDELGKYWLSVMWKCFLKTSFLALLELAWIFDAKK